MRPPSRPSAAAFAFLAILLAWRVVLPEFTGPSRECTLCEITARTAADSLTQPPALSPEAAARLATPPARAAGNKPPSAPSVDDHWAEPVKERTFAAFQTWVTAYENADAGTRPALEAEGISLAAARRKALADLIVSKPERALELAAPERVRRTLPQGVRDLLETPVNALADYRVVCLLPPPEAREKPNGLLREAVIDGKTHQVFTFGQGLRFVTEANAPVSGIALPADAGTNPPPPGLSKPDMLLALDPAPRVAALTTGGGGGHAGHDREDGATAASARTEGDKRFLFLRVRFTDGSYTISQSAARTLLSDLISYMDEMSYGRLRIAAEGPEGSAITPELQMSQPAAAYNDAGLSRLYPDARRAAAGAGYNLDDYDFFAVFTGNRPAAGYAGLAYVGGIGIHIANGYFDKWVLAHELGHNLGLPHAHSLNNGGTSVLGEGSTEEYGDNYDPMGNGKENSHFYSGHKQYIDWIPGEDVPRLTAGGVYRLYAQDNLHAGHGLRALRVARNGLQDYWFELREDYTDAQFQNGLLMRYANRDGRESYILDGRPRESARALIAGHTFSDPEARVHVTPLGRAQTWPSSMDTAVYFNTPGNRAPTGRLTAHSPHTAVNAPALFTMTAEDPDGHELAYAWDFGDGTFSTDNKASVTRSWSAAGEYVVQCAVSDLRGGTFRASAVITVGSPANVRRIGGRVVDRMNQPLAGLRVYTDDTRYALTDSDGSYLLTRLANGEHEVKVLEPVRNILTFDSVSPNPVTLSAAAPEVTGFDFTAADPLAGGHVELVAADAEWKYHDLGQNLGAVWRFPNYNDSAWAAGPAPLGYGEDGESTVLNYGGDPSNKRNTAYFRKSFQVADPSAFHSLRVLARRDDAVMIYLNGTRILRDNFPPAVADGSIVYNTRAAESVEPDTDIIRSGIPASLLVPGKNVLAAEVHQSDAGSSDLFFMARLSALANTPEAGARAAYLTFPRDGAEISTASTPLALTAEARAATTAVTKVEFYANGVKLGEDTAPPFEQVWWPGAVGEQALHTVTTFAGLPAPLTSGTVRCRILPPRGEVFTSGAEWKWQGLKTAAQAPPEGWTDVTFDDSAWTSGMSPLGYGGDGLSTILSGQPYATVLFRKAFDAPDPSAWSTVMAKMIRDDAAVVYLNGREVWRSNFSTSPSGAQIPQSAGPETVWHTQPLPVSLLRPGRNVLAAEVRQETGDTSDLRFDFALDVPAGESARPPGVYVTAPASVALPSAPVLRAEAIVSGGPVAGAVTFFANGAPVGEDAEFPWECSWTEAVPGAHRITAELRDAGGALMGVSAPVTVNVLPEPPGGDLVSFNGLWKFLDNGTDPGGAWMTAEFNDSAWPSGYGKFGYGGDGENTALTWTHARAKPAAAYFRRKFTVPPGTVFQALRVRLIRDDGAAVYLNGAEIIRDNLPAGRLSFGSLASAEVNGAEETAAREFYLPASALRVGENILAAETHQHAVDSDDLGFDLSLTGLTEAPAGARLWLTQPANGERLNPGAPLTARVFLSDPAAVRRVEYLAGAAKIGEANAAPWDFTWTTPLNGAFSLKARAVLADGAALDSPAVPVTVGAPSAAAVFIAPGSVWAWREETGAPPAAWRGGDAYDDTAWPRGPARLGFGGDGEKTVLPEGRITYYFRHAFEVPANTAVEDPVLQIQRDDGALVYLNGERLAAVNLNANANATTLAMEAIGGNDEQAWVNIPVTAARLRPGVNVLAVEMHQSSAGSSDVGFDARLTALVSRSSGLFNSTPSAAPLLSLRPATAPDPRTPGALELFLSEPDGRVYVIESSADLETWNPLGTRIIAGGAGLAFPVTPANPATGRAFYRARWLPHP